jgi:glycosyltransferase involved in cell wall biosynthesis
MKNYDSQIIPIFGNLDNLKRLLKINDNEKILKFKKYKMIDYNIIKYLFVSPLLLFNLTNYIIRIFCFIFILKAIFFKNKIKLNKRKRDIEFYILIPIYNEEKNLEKLIKNLVIHDKINYIMINDCSSDKSVNVLNKYKKEYNFKIINRIYKRGFVSGVLNDSIKFINKTKKSSGTYIGVVNADSYLKKETIKNIYSFLSEYDLDILNFKNVPILNNNNFINTIESFEKNFKNKLSENIEVSLNNGYLIKYKYLDLVNFWNEKEITEDLNLTIKLKQLNCNFYQSNFKIYDNLPKNIISLFNQKYRWIKGDLKNRIRYYPRDFFELIVNIYYLFPLYFLIYLFLNLFINFDFNKIIITQFIISFVEISLYFIFTNTFNLNLIFYAIYQLSLKLFFYIRYFINLLEDDKWY